MIDNKVIITLFLCGLIIISIPIILGIIIRKKYGKISVAVIAGFISFFIFQVIIRMPILQALSTKEWFKAIPNTWMIFLLATTAALFETGGRYLTIKFILKKDLSFSSGLAHGIGHGGTEAALLVGLNFVIYGIMSILFNAGVMDNALSIESIAALKNILETTAFYQYFWGTLERISTLMVQIGLSVMVVYALKVKKPIILLYVFLIHTLVDFSSVYLLDYILHKTLYRTWAVPITEGLIFIYGICMLIVILGIKGVFKNTRNIDKMQA